MIIGNREVEQIIITDNNDGLLVIVSDDEIVNHDGIKVIIDGVSKCP